MASAGHAHSVPAAGGAGCLHNDSSREPERVWLQLWSDCKFCICPSIIFDLFSEVTDRCDLFLKKTQTNQKKKKKIGHVSTYAGIQEFSRTFQNISKRPPVCHIRQ